MLNYVLLTPYQGAILGPIAKVLGWILEKLYEGLSLVGIENVGICIILFTFIVNGLMIPIQVKQQKFSRMSAKMNPELMAIQNKYKNKKDETSIRKMQMEQQAVYQKYGVSPASGCLPLLISMPILFALYRVIYNVPAYVGPVCDLYNNLADGLMNCKDYVDVLAGYIAGTDQAKAILADDNTHQTVTVIMKKWPELTEALKNNTYIVDVLSQFRSETWEQLRGDFPSLKATIDTTMQQVNHVNNFFGANISDTPSWNGPTILVPIFAVITQILSTKISMAGSPQMQNQEDNTMNSTMKTMNTVMPFVSGIMCLMMPIGLGLYWIAGSVFRIFQGLCINFYMDHLDIDEEMKKNMEKAEKRFEKMGITQEEMNRIARQKTTDLGKPKKTNISKAAASVKNSQTNSKNGSKSSSKSTGNKKPKNQTNNSKGNPKYKEGSIAAYANMLNRNQDD